MAADVGVHYQAVETFFRKQNNFLQYRSERRITLLKRPLLFDLTFQFGYTFNPYSTKLKVTPIEYTI